MDARLYLEGEVSLITLSNLHGIEGLDFEGEDIKDEEDIKTLFERIDAFAESGELNLATDVRRFKVMPPEGIVYLGLKVEEKEEKEKSLDAFELKNESFDALKSLLSHAEAGDLIYLRREQGRGNWTFSFECGDEMETMRFAYFDCSGTIDQYDLLTESYYDVLCDTILPETLTVGESKAQVENFDIEPQIVYGELYKVVEDPETWDKHLIRLKVPGFYFLDKTRAIDE